MGLFDFFISGMMPLLPAGIISDSQYEKSIRDTVLWADGIMTCCGTNHYKYVACLKLVNGIVSRLLLAKHYNSIVYEVAKEYVGEIENLQLSEEHFKELKEKGVVVAKVYEDTEK